jgi:hypothetical protein
LTFLSRHFFFSPAHHFTEVFNATTFTETWQVQEKIKAAKEAILTFDKKEMGGCKTKKSQIGFL